MRKNTSLYRVVFLFAFGTAGCFITVPPPVPAPLQGPNQRETTLPPEEAANNLAAQPPDANPDDASSEELLVKNPKPTLEERSEKPVPDPIEQLRFEALKSWSILGNTPLASWSPDHSKIAIFSDLPQKSGEKNSKKYIQILDVNTAKMKKLGPIITTSNIPIWLDDTSLIFKCYKNRCGNGKDGVYVFNIKKNLSKNILPKKPEEYLDVFPTSEGTLLIKRTDQGHKNPDGSFYPAVHHPWQEWDLKTRKLFEREDIPLKHYSPPKNFYQFSECSPNYNGIHFYVEDGKMGALNNKTKERRVLTEVSMWASYPGSTRGHSPCVAPEGNFLIYYSLNENEQGIATLMKVEGW